MDTRAPFVSIDVFIARAPVAIYDAVGEAVLATLSEARERADELAVTHRESIIQFAQALHDARRLSDQALRDALTAAGLPA